MLCLWHGSKLKLPSAPEHDNPQIKDQGAERNALLVIWRELLVKPFNTVTLGSPWLTLKIPPYNYGFRPIHYTAILTGHNVHLLRVSHRHPPWQVDVKIWGITPYKREIENRILTEGIADERSLAFR